MSASLVVHDALARGAIDSHEGYLFATGGDSFAAAFTRASDAVSAAVAAQAALERADWPGPSLEVRVGLHQGEAEERHLSPGMRTCGGPIGQLTVPLRFPHRTG